MSSDPSSTTEGLPIFSYKRLTNLETRGAFLDELRTTLSTIGFFYLVDFEDAVSTPLYEKMGREAKRFFDLPLETRSVDGRDGKMNPTLKLTIVSSSRRERPGSPSLNQRHHTSVDTRPSRPRLRSASRTCVTRLISDQNAPRTRRHR